MHSYFTSLNTIWKSKISVVCINIAMILMLHKFKHPKAKQNDL